MSCLSYLNPVEVLDKLLRDQDEPIEAVYKTKYRQVWESASVSVELELPGFIIRGNGTCLEDAKQKAALAMMEKLEVIHSQSNPVTRSSDKNCSLALKSTKKFWANWRLKKELANLLKQLAQIKGQEFSSLDGQLNRVRDLYMAQDMENQSSVSGNVIEKLPSTEIKATEKSFSLSKESLEIHDKKVGKMTVIDRLGISSLESTGEDIEKKKYDHEAMTETTSIDSINTFDAKSSSTFDQSEEGNPFSFSGIPDTQTTQNNFDEVIDTKNEVVKAGDTVKNKLRHNDNKDGPTTTEPITEEKGNGIEERNSKEPIPINFNAEYPMKWLMLTVQSGCDYEAEEKDVLHCLSKFGEVEVLEWAKVVGYYKGGGGRVKFADNSTAVKVVNRLFTVDGCSFHTSWMRQDLHLLPGPVPFQVLLESDHLPHTWEKHMIVKKAMAGYGEVLAVDFINSRKVLVSFSDEWVVQNLIGCWWKVHGTPVLAKEVSPATLSD